MVKLLLNVRTLLGESVQELVVLAETDPLFDGDSVREIVADDKPEDDIVTVSLRVPNTLGEVVQELVLLTETDPVLDLKYVCESLGVLGTVRVIVKLSVGVPDTLGGRVRELVVLDDRLNAPVTVAVIVSSGVPDQESDIVFV